MKKRPETINIFGKTYSVTYCDRVVDVDINGERQLLGQIDYDTRSIRVFAKDRQLADVLDTLLHEVMHGVAIELKLKHFTDEEAHDDLDVLAMGLTCVLMQNEWIEVEDDTGN